MAHNENISSKRDRFHFLDNLRAFIIFLVVLYHAGGVYESSGIWASFWIVDDTATNELIDFLTVILDIFMMPTLFFISGYLAPSSLKSKSGWGFLNAKFKRLIVPWIVAVFTLIPLYKVIFLYARNLPQEHWSSYFFFSNGIINQSWLWFLPVLFLFNLLYLLVSRVKIRISNISLRGAVLVIFLIGFANSAYRDFFGLRGWTNYGVLDYQNERFSVYFLVFLLGALCFRLKIYNAERVNKKLYIFVNFIAWIPITIFVFFSHHIYSNPGYVIVSEIIDRLVYWLSYQLSLLCLMYVMIETFRRYLNKSGKMWNELTQNSYTVYIIHVIVLGVIALALINTAIASLLKFLILALSTYLVSNLISSLYRQVATSRRTTNQLKIIDSSQ